MTNYTTLYSRLVSSLTLAVLLCSLSVHSVAALSPEQSQLFDDAIYYFNYSTEKVTSCGPGKATAGAGGASDASVESDNVRVAYEFFVAKGLEPFRAAGIVGNLQVEAPGLDPNINQGNGGPGRGIAQWSVTERWVDLQKFAEGAPGPADDRSPRDLRLQLDFIWHEMNNVAPWKQALPGIQGATDITAATRSFMLLFEKPGDPQFEKRLTAANAILGLYAPGAPTSGAAAPGGTTEPAGTVLGPVGKTACPPTGGNFSGAPGQTKPLGGGFTLNENTDYAGTPCAPGSTESRIYLHPARGFQIRICVIDGTTIDIASIVSDRVVAMVAAAKGAGVTLNGGGFRTYEEQLAARVANGCNEPAGTSNEGCYPATASPGNSQHERGLAIDFVTNGGSRLPTASPQFNWLSANAAQYRFYNLPIESWHWSTSGS